MTRAAVLRINQRLLKLGGARDGIGNGFSRAVLTSELARENGQEEQKMLADMHAVVASMDRDALAGGFRGWAVKEPRLLLTFHLWRRVLASPICVIVFCDPAKALARGARRNSKLSERGEQLRFEAAWRGFYAAALEACRSDPVVLVDSDALQEKPLHAARRLVDDLVDSGDSVRFSNAVRLAANLAARSLQGLVHAAPVVDATTIGVHRRLEMLHAPLVTSIFVPLAANKTKHAYPFRHSLHVSAPYLLFCAPKAMCERATAIRAARGLHTDVVPFDMNALVAELATVLNVTVAALWAAASSSLHRRHCPSAELVLLWIAKPFLVRLAMARHPERHAFAYVDTGFNYYERMKRSDPPQPPWQLRAHSGFWPRRGLAARSLRAEKVCHNDLRATSHSYCPLGTFFYGARAHWEAVIAAYATRIRSLVQTREAWASKGLKMVCSDQDVHADIAKEQPGLYDAFSTAELWGWANASARAMRKKVMPAPAILDQAFAHEASTTVHLPQQQQRAVHRASAGLFAARLQPCQDEQPLQLGSSGVRHAIASLLTSDLLGAVRSPYLLALLVLGSSLEQHASRLPRLLMALENVRLDHEAILALAEVGWQVCSVPRLLPPHPSTNHRFREQFAKLEMLRMEQFDRILYVDSDVLAIRDITPILRTPMREGVYLAATQDMRGSKAYAWAETFNCGVMVIRPSRIEYNRLLNLLRLDKVPYERVMSEQGFLNAVYPGQAASRLALGDGANLATFAYSRPDWDRAWPEMRLIHYTMSKPWACRPPYLPICSLWRDVNATLHARRAARPSWCDRVSVARGMIAPALRVSYPCRGLRPARSAIATMLTDSLSESKVTFGLSNYVKGVLALGRSVQNHMLRHVHQLLLVRDGVSVPAADRPRLAAVGWILGTVPTILPPRTPRFKRFRSQFSKLALMGLTEYECVFYMDADTLAIGSLDRLLDSSALFQQAGQRLAAARDFFGGRWSANYNMGIFGLQPNASELDRVHMLLLDGHVTYNFEQSEQGFLNKVFPLNGPNVVELPFEASGNSALEVRATTEWGRRLRHLRIIHFTERKPWQCAERQGPAVVSSGSQRMSCGDGYSAARSDTACYCAQAFRWWAALREAERHVATKLALARDER